MLADRAESGRSGAHVPAESAPSLHALRWLIGLRLLIISALFLGVLVIQARASEILPLGTFYWLFLFTYGLSLCYLTLYLLRVQPRMQVIVQLLGDIGVVSGFVYATGGLYSPFSFLYLTVIVEASVFLRRWGYLFAGLSAVAYGILVDLMFFDILPIQPNLVGTEVPSDTGVLSQLLIHVVGFTLVTFLVYRLIGSHRRLEEETERAKQFLALTDHVVRSVSSGILACDLDGRVLHLNPAGARILGVNDLESVTGREVPEVMPMGERQWKQMWSLACNRPIRFNDRIEGRELHLGLTVGPLEDEQSNLVGFVINFQDLSEIEREAERHRQQERMAAVGEMSARLAHEIKNPLASISGAAQMLGSLDTADDTGHRLLSILVNESRRLSLILDGYLDYARPRQSAKQASDLTALLQDCFDLLKRSDEVNERHRLALQVPDQLLINGDEDQLRQIFWNLSRNAIQALPDGGDITISAHEEGGKAVLRWQDNGPGMPEEIRQRAFEPFVTNVPDGTGLGLAVVFSVVEDHNGSVQIDSAPGQGTTVTVELPCCV